MQRDIKVYAFGYPPLSSLEVQPGFPSEVDCIDEIVSQIISGGIPTNEGTLIITWVNDDFGSEYEDREFAEIYEVKKVVTEPVITVERKSEL